MKPVEMIQGENWPGDFELTGAAAHNWHVRKRTLQGGFSQGLEVIQVCNGPWDVTILTGKGMSLWRGSWNGNFLGWKSPVKGPVNPHWVELERRGGLGWLDGFDEWFCRCGLVSNGPPGVGANGQRYTLHGRIANLPSRYVKVETPENTPGMIRVTGIIEETSLFSPKLRLTTVYEFPLGQDSFRVQDQVENLGDSPAEFQLLYHCNLGKPLLGPNSIWSAPLTELAPQTPNAAKGIDRFPQYGPSQPGYKEQVFLCKPKADINRWSMASLYNPDNKLGFVIRFDTSTLPYFTCWKNLGAAEEGFVTGLEPATNFPNFIDFERANGRVQVLPPKSAWVGNLSLGAFQGETEYSKTLAEIQKIQPEMPLVHKNPTMPFSPVT
ncbi:MAG: DUF4432 family protein [Gemmataceae bacterium]|nr:DUF4432 family protein [Gemmataceae bacterium]